MTRPVKPAAPGDDDEPWQPARPRPRPTSATPAAVRPAREDGGATTPAEAEEDEATPESRRSPALLATLVALPVAVIVGLLVYWNIGGFAPTTGVAEGDPPRLQDTSPVQVSAEAITPAQVAACRDLIAILPQTGIRDAARRAVVNGPEQNAAFGDPAITLTCGGAGGLNQAGPRDTVYGLNDVCWLSIQGADYSLWTTADRAVPVAVKIPAGYQQPGQWAIEFSNSVSATIPRMAKPPAGCAKAPPPPTQ